MSFRRESKVQNQGKRSSTSISYRQGFISRAQMHAIGEQKVYDVQKSPFSKSVSGNNVGMLVQAMKVFDLNDKKKMNLLRHIEKSDFSNVGMEAGGDGSRGKPYEFSSSEEDAGSPLGRAGGSWFSKSEAEEMAMKEREEADKQHVINRTKVALATYEKSIQEGSSGMDKELQKLKETNRPRWETGSGAYNEEGLDEDGFLRAADDWLSDAVPNQAAAGANQAAAGANQAAAGADQAAADERTASEAKKAEKIKQRNARKRAQYAINKLKKNRGKVQEDPFDVRAGDEMLARMEDKRPASKIEQDKDDRLGKQAKRKLTKEEKAAAKLASKEAWATHKAAVELALKKEERAKTTRNLTHLKNRWEQKESGPHFRVINEIVKKGKYDRLNSLILRERMENEIKKLEAIIRKQEEVNELKEKLRRAGGSA